MKHFTGVAIAVLLGMMAAGLRAADEAGAITATGGEIAKAFYDDKAAAAAKYKGKAVEVTGAVQYPAEGDGNTFVMVGGQNGARVGTIVLRFAVEEKEKQAARELTTGQEVTVRGTIGELGVGIVEVGEATIIKKGTDPAVTVSAGDLAGAFVENAGEATKKFDDHEVLMEGKIKSVDKENCELTLEGAGEGKDVLNVRVMLGLGEWPRAEKFKVGEVIKVKGRCMYSKRVRELTVGETVRVMG